MIPTDLLLLLLWGGFAAVMAWYGVITLILQYHWRSYAIRGESTSGIARRYYIFSFILVVGSLLSLLAYSATL